LALLPGLLSLALFILATGCGKQEASKEAPVDAPAAPNPNAKPVDTSTAGVVSGVVKLDGTAPKMRTINMRSVPTCNQMH
jgi:hypothetical protein